MSSYGVKIERGTVTHWKDGPLTTYERARECRNAIRDYTGEEGEIVNVLASIPPPVGGDTPEEPRGFSLTGFYDDPCGCGHDHTTGRKGSCSKFTCDCHTWYAPTARVSS